MAIDYRPVTEAAGNLVSREAIDMARTRYTFAANYCGGKRVLEIACGPGTGLGHLRQHAQTIVGGDCTEGLLRAAREHYGQALPLVRLDAQALPFRSGCFDVIVLFEAIYFLADAALAFDACRSTLAPDGVLILATANPARLGFIRSPHSTSYFTGPELASLLRTRGFAVELFGGFPVHEDGVGGRVVGHVRQAADALHVIPRTMKGKEFLKRLVFGKLVAFPPEVTASTGTYRPPVPLDDDAAADRYKVIYAVCHRRADLARA